MTRWRSAIARNVRRAWWNTTEPFRVDRTPAWITLGILLVGVPLLAWRLFNGFSAADFGIVVLTATLIAILWTAHYTFRTVRHARQAEERAERRRSLTRMSMAAAVSAELQWLQPSLSLLRARIHTRQVRFLERPRLRDALSNLDLFSVSVASSLSEFDAILQQIEVQCALFGADHEAAEHAAIAYRLGSVAVDPLKRDPQWVETIRRFIDAAIDLIPILKHRLLTEV